MLISLIALLSICTSEFFSLVEMLEVCAVTLTYLGVFFRKSVGVIIFFTVVVSSVGCHFLASIAVTNDGQLR